MFKGKNFHLSIITLLLFGAIPSMVGAETVLDQSYLTVNGIAGLTSSGAQTFTTGVDGTLSSVTVLVRDLTGVTFALLDTTAGVPDFPDSGHPPIITIPLADQADPINPVLLSIDLSSFNIVASRGDVLALALLVPYGGVGGRASWTAGTRVFDAAWPDYLGGQAFYEGQRGVWGPQGSDFGFRTFVTRVPEPTTLFLLGSGLVGLAGFCRKFRKR